MSTKRILANEIDSNLDYEVIGLDLAKQNVSFVGITTDGEVIRIDRVDYSVLLEKATEMAPTTSGMEPCTEMNWLCNELKQRGHICKVFSGLAVQAQIQAFFSGQKNDLNDAEAIAFLAKDDRLTSIRAKTQEQMILQSLCAARELHLKHSKAILVSLKGQAQAWGLKIAKALSSEAKLLNLIESASNVPQEVRELLAEQVKACKLTERKANQLKKRIEEKIQNNPLCQMAQKIPGIGPMTAANLAVTIGDINRFDKPKKLPAYYGLVPKNLTSGHIEKMGRITKRGDKRTRTLLVQGANVLLMLESKGKLPKCQLQKWIAKKRRELSYCRLVIALAAKLLRILWACLKYGKDFDIRRAGIARCNLPTKMRAGI